MTALRGQYDDPESDESEWEDDEQPPDPPIAQLDQEVEQAGQGPDLNPDTPPLAVVNEVPGNPQETNPAIEATTATPDPAGTPATNPNPLIEITTAGVQNALSDNNAEAVPAPRALRSTSRPLPSNPAQQADSSPLTRSNLVA